MVEKILDTEIEEKVLKADHPVILDFWNQGCGPCQALGPVLEELSEEEKEIVANVVKYNTVPLEGYDKIGSSRMTRENYLTIAKLTAILGVVNSLDRSHKQKTKEAKQILHENELVIQLYSDEDLSLEKKEFAKKAEFFEEVFSIRPVLRQKKMM